MQLPGLFVSAAATHVLYVERFILNAAFSFNAISHSRLKEGSFEMRLLVFIPPYGTENRTTCHVSCRMVENRYCDVFSRT